MDNSKHSKDDFNPKKVASKSIYSGGLATALGVGILGAVNPIGTATLVGKTVVDLALSSKESKSKIKDTDTNDTKINVEKENVDSSELNHQDILDQVVNPALSNFLKEIAIAERINNSETVEIEEYFEGSGKGEGGIGVDFQAKTGKLGGSGESSKITKRVYKFTGLDGSVKRIADLLEKATNEENSEQ
ncbi:hypothetical protein [Enterococcus italicus]|uniref:hypothetical protein n=1 Tax=Enterococcus italicus TaxID=246144 RepID=UPI0020734268|nr:hypothetical protein [Enterococcus italicus]